MQDSKKDAHYFTHDSNASHDAKMIALIAVYDVTGYGRFWLLIEFLRQQQDYKYPITQKFSHTSLSKVLRCSPKKCKDFIEDCINQFDLLKTDGQFIWSDSLVRRMQMWDEKRRILSERGRKGAAATNELRWGASPQATDQVSTSDDPVNDKRVATSDDFIAKEEKRRENNIKEENGVCEASDALAAHTQEKVDKEEFKFPNWLEEHAPTVMQMEEPFTKNQFAILKSKYPVSIIKKLLNSMQNNKKLNGNRSALMAFEKFYLAEKCDREIIEHRDGQRTMLPPWAQYQRQTEPSKRMMTNSKGELLTIDRETGKIIEREDKYGRKLDP